MRKEVKIINNYKNHIINVNATSFEYESWRDDFKLKQIREAYDKFIDENDVDWRDFTKEELLGLGFSAWDENLIVMPLWAYHVCQDEIVLTSIDGDKSTKGKGDIDTDVRGGCIAYGFTEAELLKRNRKIKLEEIEKNFN
jgi:hypothetical protein